MVINTNLEYILEVSCSHPFHGTNIGDELADRCPSKARDLSKTERAVRIMFAIEHTPRHAPFVQFLDSALTSSRLDDPDKVGEDPFPNSQLELVQLINHENILDVEPEMT